MIITKMTSLKINLVTKPYHTRAQPLFKASFKFLYKRNPDGSVSSDSLLDVEHTTNSDNYMETPDLIEEYKVIDLKHYTELLVNDVVFRFFTINEDGDNVTLSYPRIQRYVYPVSKTYETNQSTEEIYEFYFELL